jgi:hypothetical protein
MGESAREETFRGALLVCLELLAVEPEELEEEAVLLSPVLFVGVDARGETGGDTLSSSSLLVEAGEDGCDVVR